MSKREPVETTLLKVLLIEDSESYRALATAYLARPDDGQFGVIEASSLQEGLDVLRASRVDCVLLDMLLPDADGFNGLEAVLTAAPQVPVVVLTGRDDDELGNLALRRGAQDFLGKKDATASIVRRTVRHAVERQRKQLALERANDELARQVRVRQEAEQALRAQRDLSAALLAAMHEGYLFTNADAIVDVNDALCHLTGLTRDELVGRRPPGPFWADSELVAATVYRGGDAETTVVHRDGREVPVAISVSPVRDAHGALLGHITTLRDVTNIHRRETALKEIAERDPLTGLLNRRAVDELFARVEDGDAVAMLDLDTFKQVNDEHGHAVGDATLQAFAACISSTLRPTDWCGRLGGDEFILVARNAGALGAVVVLERIGLAWTARGPLTTFSAGTAVHDQTSEPRQTLARADEALYLAKRSGRGGTVHAHTPPVEVPPSDETPV